MNYNPEMNNEKKFEDELFNSLKFYGYLFPENVSQIEAFEGLHNESIVNAPSINDILLLESGASVDNSINLEIGLAAYSSSDDTFLDIPEEDSEDPEKK
ncbi:MAG: hypothetical protein ABIN36_07460 [Ferruginibacter sp.]